MPKKYLIDTVAPGTTCYLSQRVIMDLFKTFTGTAYMLHGVPVTLHDHENKTWIKSKDRFQGVDLPDLLEQCERLGVSQPSSYSMIVHKLFYTPRLRYGYNLMLSHYREGGWEQAFDRGVVKIPLYKYDLNSAYASALSYGLPDCPTVKFVGRRSRCQLMIADCTMKDQKHPYRGEGACLRLAVTTAEIETFNLNVVKVYIRLAWKMSMKAPDQLFKIFDLFPIVKKALMRSFWGIWAGWEPIEVAGVRDGTIATSRPLYNIRRNLLFALLIVKHVKARIGAELLSQASHVYVDSVITSRQIPTGSALGQWRLVASYPKGLTISGPGQYQLPDKTWVKRIGVPGGGCGDGHVEAVV